MAFSLGSGTGTGAERSLLCACSSAGWAAKAGAGDSAKARIRAARMAWRIKSLRWTQEEARKQYASRSKPLPLDLGKTKSPEIGLQYFYIRRRAECNLLS